MVNHSNATSLLEWEETTENMWYFQPHKPEMKIPVKKRHRNERDSTKKVELIKTVPHYGTNFPSEADEQPIKTAEGRKNYFELFGSPLDEEDNPYCLYGNSRRIKRKH